MSMRSKVLNSRPEGGERRPHPSDRRARVVVLTDAARAEFYWHFGERMGRVRDGMSAFSDDELRAIVRFLGEMETVLAE